MRSYQGRGADCTADVTAESSGKDGRRRLRVVRRFFDPSKSEPVPFTASEKSWARNIENVLSPSAIVLIKLWPSQCLMFTFYFYFYFLTMFLDDGVFHMNG